MNQPDANPVVSNPPGGTPVGLGHTSWADRPVPGGGIASRRRVNVAGVLIDDLKMAETFSEIERLVRLGRPSFIVTPNVDHIVRLQSDSALQAAYNDAALVLPDGMFVLWGSRFLGTPLRAKVSGSDLLPQFASFAAAKGMRLFFLGGRPDAARKSAEVLSQRHPGLTIQWHCPPMGFEKDPAENRKAVQMVRESRSDVLFVGLGAPKQELWMHRYYREYSVPVSIGIGATFEFVSGMVRRAPRLLQKTGLEWLWRLALEPMRMYRRYLIDDPFFFALIWKQRRNRLAALARPTDKLTSIIASARPQVGSA